MHCLLHFLLRERHWAHQCVFVSVFVCTPVYISGGIFVSLLLAERLHYRWLVWCQVWWLHRGAG